jgi:quercetin dioxygenase-like cupin family protein
MGIVRAPENATHDIGAARFTSLATPSRGSVETSVWMVDIDPGAPSVPHRLTREEVFVVLQGEATVSLDGRTSNAVAGDAIVVPPATLFSVGNDTSTILRMLCCLPVGGQAETDDGVFTPPWAQ